MKLSKLFVVSLALIASFSVAAQDITSGLAAHFNFKNAAGKECLDMTGKHKLIAPSGISTRNGALRTGKDAIYMIPHDEGLTLDEEMTISLWCAVKSVAGRQFLIFKGIRNTTPQQAMALWFANGRFEFNAMDETGAWSYPAQSEIIKTGEWRHVCTTYKAGLVKILVDGKKCFSHQYAPREIVRNNASFYVGSGLSSGGAVPDFFCDGLVNDIRIYRRSLSELEVNAIYSAESDSYRSQAPDLSDERPMPTERKTAAAATEVPNFGDYRNGDRQLYWGQEPVEAVSATRGRICLNGEWDFWPVVTSGGASDIKHAGGIQVPGTWSGWGWKGYTKTVENSISKRNADPIFNKITSFQQWDQLDIRSAWYRRIIHVPSSWNGREIRLELSRVSTDARVFVNQQFCGEINWPSGGVDISKAVTPGADAELAILVSASPEQEDVFVPVWESSNEYKISEKKVDCSGLVDDVFLLSRPRGAFISDVFVKTSTRKQELTLEVEVQGSQSGSADVTASILGPEGREEKRFTTRVTLTGQPVQTFSESWAWTDPVLWDAENPRLYTLLLTLKGTGLDDVCRQDFGFREFWIEGKSFFLNGVEIQFRPIFDNMTPFGIAEAIDNHLDGFKQNGFNLCAANEYPKEFSIRGTLGAFADLNLERRDVKGMYSFYFLPSLWNTADNFETKKEKWEKVMRQELKALRNHPSLLFWGFFSGNLSHQSVKWPQLSGKSSARELFSQTDIWREAAGRAEKSYAAIRQYDPTRPVTGANSPSFGDICGFMPYLNFIPLQEREEWFSEWATNGDLPVMLFEYGSPIAAAFARARSPSHMGTSEPWVTEFCAIYLGRKAYELEEPAYRRKTIAEHFVKDQQYRFWYSSEEKTPYATWAPIPTMTPQAQAVLSLFHRNTWRSWRTWGISGGMFLWEYGAGWADYNFSRGGINPKREKEIVSLGQFVPGRRGVYVPEIIANIYYGLTPLGLPPMPCGKDLVENNQSTLAWIAGSAAAFTEKDHSYSAGTQVNKQIVLINSTRQVQPFSATWKVTLGNDNVGSESKNGTIEPGKTCFLPVSFTLPAVSAKTDGSITLTAKIGTYTHNDVFSFRAFPVPVKKKRAVAAFDPEGKTTAMLVENGCAVTRWQGEKDAALVVIGKQALNAERTLPADFQAYIQAGGRGIVFTQHPEFFRSQLDLRVSRHVTRRAFVVESQRIHPAINGIDNEDLRDWSGISNLIEGYPSYPIKKDNLGWCPPYGWHWGNRGGVASAAIEKPHHSGWRPILECEFDLAYSPLMELDYGKGRLLVCTLDLEDHYQQDAAAAVLVGNLLDYALNAPLKPKADKVVFIGDDNEAKLLDEIGLIYTRATQVEQAGLIVAGSRMTDSPELDTYLQAGGSVFFLPRKKPVLGVSFQEVSQFPGSLSVPNWQETRGLGISDLHWRCDSPATLIKNGADSCADGLVGRLVRWNGNAFFCQIDPEGFDKQKTYYHFSEWRSRRALVNLLSNMGARFLLDERVFSMTPLARTVSLKGWRMKMGRKLPFSPSLSQKHKDDGISEEATAMVRPETNDSGWHEGTLGMWPNYGGEFAQYSGECVYRKKIDLPPEFVGKDIVLRLPCVNDIDDTYFNGEKIGRTEIWNQKRRYEIPGRLVKQNNVLAVRTFQGFRGGGFDVKEAADAFIQTKDAEKGFYHPDYRVDDALGDEPYTYYHW